MSWKPNSQLPKEAQMGHWGLRGSDMPVGASETTGYQGRIHQGGHSTWDQRDEYHLRWR